MTNLSKKVIFLLHRTMAEPPSSSPSSPSHERERAHVAAFVHGVATQQLFFHVLPGVQLSDSGCYRGHSVRQHGQLANGMRLLSQNMHRKGVGRDL